MNIEKFLRRRFSPLIDEKETIERVNSAKNVAEFVAGGRLSNAISAIYLFGSTARKEARKSSDIDLAVCLSHIPDLEIDRLGYLLWEEVMAAKEKNGIDRNLTINVTLIDENRFDPHWESSPADPTDQIIKSIQREGVLLA